MKKIVCAFSGGLDTSFCVPYLIEQGFEVYTIFVNTGGTATNEEKKISNRALELGAKKHLNVNVELKLWNQIIKPLLFFKRFFYVFLIENNIIKFGKPL